MIRPATIGDLAALIEIETTAFTLDRISRRSFRHLLTRANALSLVEESAEGLCGYVTVLFRRGSPRARLYSIATPPRSRGQGVGGRLLAAAERESRRRGCTALQLEVDPSNARALSLYERAGYREFGRYHDFYENGADAIRMEKQLQPAEEEAPRGRHGNGPRPPASQG